MNIPYRFSEGGASWFRQIKFTNRARAWRKVYKRRRYGFNCSIRKVCQPGEEQASLRRWKASFQHRNYRPGKRATRHAETVLFVREQNPLSVIANLLPGRALDEGNIAYLVSSAVLVCRNVTDQADITIQPTPAARSTTLKEIYHDEGHSWH